MAMSRFRGFVYLHLSCMAHVSDSLEKGQVKRITGKDSYKDIFFIFLQSHFNNNENNNNNKAIIYHNLCKLLRFL